MIEKIKKSGPQMLIYAIIYAVLLVLLINRICYTVAHYDEIFNIYVSYLTAIMGKQHLVDNTYLFQMGNLFNLPFVYAFCKITGGSQGLVLFIRGVYFVFQALLSGVLYICLKDRLGKANSFLFSMIILIYSPFEMYTLYYDTAALTFMLAGALLLVAAGSFKPDDKVIQVGKNKAQNRESEAEGFNSESTFSFSYDKKTSRKAMIFRVIAGVLHACMTYAYPLMALLVIGTIIAIAVMEEKGKKSKAVFHYLCGLGIVFAIFLIYVFGFCGGIKNLFIFKEGQMEKSLNGRVLGDIQNGGVKKELTGTWHDIAVLDKLYWIIMEMRSSLYELIVPSIIFVIQWAIGLKFSKKWKLLVIPEIIIAGLINYHAQNGGFVFTRLFAFYFFWAPLFYFYIKNEKSKEIARRILAFIWFPSGLAFISVGYTALFEAKAIMGFYAGGIATLIIMVLVVKDYFEKVRMDCILILALSAIHLGLFYANVYENDKVSDCDYKAQSGILKGIYTTEQDVFYEDMYTYLQENGQGKSCYFTSKYTNYPLSLMTCFTDSKTDMKSLVKQLNEGEGEIPDKSMLSDMIVVTLEEEKNLEDYIPVGLLDLYEIQYNKYDNYVLVRK